MAEHVRTKLKRIRQFNAILQSPASPGQIPLQLYTRPYDNTKGLPLTQIAVAYHRVKTQPREECPKAGVGDGGQDGEESEAEEDPPESSCEE